MSKLLRYSMLALTLTCCTATTLSYAEPMIAEGMKPVGCNNSGNMGAIFTINNGYSDMLQLIPTADSTQNFLNLNSSLAPGAMISPTYCGSAGELSSLSISNNGTFTCTFGFKMDSDGHMTISIEQQEGNTGEANCVADNNQSIRIGS